MSNNLPETITLPRGVTSGKMYELYERIDEIRAAACVSTTLASVQEWIEVHELGDSACEYADLNSAVELSLRDQGTAIFRLAMDARELAGKIYAEVSEASRKANEEANPGRYEAPTLRAVD